MMTKDLALKRRSEWERVFSTLANETIDDARFQKMLGSLAWGRYEGESHPDERADHVNRGIGFLEGYRAALLNVSRVLDLPQERLLSEAHP